MTVNCLNVSDATAAIVSSLVVDASIGMSGVQVECSEPEPNEPPVNGWVGVYVSRHTMPSVVAGAGNSGRNHEVEFVIACVQSDPTSGQDCHERLSILVKNVVDSINNTNLAGVFDYISSMRAQYSTYEKDDVRFRQVAYIFVSGLKRI